MMNTTSDASLDAVIVLPGLMGSELIDASSGRVLWGLADPTWYVKAWTTGSSLRDLAVTDDERQGRVGRIRATRTLRVPAFAPLLQGIEPYTDLLAGAEQFVAHPDALLEFAYDWRLPISHNAAELAKVADQHLTRWRQHPKGSSDARLILVAHSMGGLVARYFTQCLGGSRDVRDVVTLGTPFFGAAKAVVMLSTGRGAPLPLPRQRLLRMARTLPGLHDLLPSYRCVDMGNSARQVSADDIALLGGDRELAQQAFERRARLLQGQSVNLHSVVGVQQPTIQSVRIVDGVAEPLFHTCYDGPNGGIQRVDRGGDSTVFRDAACLPGSSPTHLPQSHSALAKSEEGVAHACSVMNRRPLGPPLGDGGVGLEVPDCLALGHSLEILAHDVDDPAAVTCQVDRVELGGDRFVERPYFSKRDESATSKGVSMSAVLDLPWPGLYRVSVKAGAASPVSQLVLAFDPAGADQVS